MTTERTTRMTTKRPSHTRYLKIHDDVWKALKKEAEWDHRTITNLVQKILAEWMRETTGLRDLRKEYEETKKEKEGER